MTRGSLLFPSQSILYASTEHVLEDGDSGGTFTSAPFDADGPVIALLSQTSGGIFGAVPWNEPSPDTERPIDWIWRVLDPEGRCTSGSTQACVWDGTTDVLPDADGDGLPDMRDLCPNDSTMASGALVRDGQHVDSDGDYVGDDCDPHPGVCEHLDSDGDGLPDDLDPCPFVAVPGGAHSDRDGDGLGDECDNCPDAPNAGQEDRDDDGRGDVCDNCLEQFNPSQTNCNAEAEEEVNRRREAAMMGHASVLSATREALWVLGGRALEDGRELRDAWRLDVRSGTWMRLTLPPSYVPGRILAATYSAVDQRLWVLDEMEESGERVARLVRVPPEGGGAQLVASWPRRSRNEGFALAADPYGALWVAGWPTSGRVHAVLRLERRTATTWAVSGWDLGVGRLVDGGVRANARGVSVLAQVREGRGPSLEFHATSELRSGPGGESACF